jgi:putative selenate reductase
MVGGAIPTYRLPQAQIDQDVAPLERLGVRFRYGVQAGRDFTLAGLRVEGCRHVIVAVGAQLAKRLGLEGEDAAGVMDGIAFLRSIREGDPVPVGPRVVVIGAGDTAMDCARSAWRLGAEATIVYRRTIDQMPADREEVAALLEEGIEVVELASPVALRVEAGRLRGVACTRMEYRGERDAGGRKIPFEVPDSRFEVPCDTMLLAISQHSVLDFFGDEQPRLTERGYLETDPETLETSVPGVYAAGDVAAHGPSSIVQAAADGKRAAAAVLQQALPGPPSHRPPADVPALLARRAHRAWRVPVRHVPVDRRRSFAKTLITYTPEEARAEASRCVDCHEMCSICVGVCPNLAILTYATEPATGDVPVLSVTASGEVAVARSEPLRIDQALQVAVLTDFCNECGNCSTFCPTAGDPYRDKPRLYLDRGDFEAQDDNAFLVSRDGDTWAVETRWGGATHRVRLEGDGTVAVAAPGVTARLDPQTWAVLEATPNGPAPPGEVSLVPAATALALLAALRRSVPHFPANEEPGTGTRVSAPAYGD